MQRDRVYLGDILSAAMSAQEYMLGLNFEAFLSSRQKQDAVIRSPEVIGEASRRLSDEAKAAMPEIPWEGFRRMRNILIHQYDSVDLNLVYDTVNRALPVLERAIRDFLKRTDQEEPP